MSHPVRIVQRQIVPSLSMLEQRHLPGAGQPAAAGGIDQPVARAGQQQQRHRRRLLRRMESRSGQQLAQHIAVAHRPGLLPADPVVQQRLHPGRVGRDAAGQRQDGRFALGQRHQAKLAAQQHRPGARLQALPEGIERPHTGVDQHHAGQLAGMALRPGDGHHRAQRHRQQVQRSTAQTCRAQLRADLLAQRLDHVLDPAGAGLQMRAAVARQIGLQQQRPLARPGPRQPRREIAPVARIAAQPAQQHADRRRA